MDNLEGRVALVTGGSRGIGRAISAALAEAGMRVAINYRTRSEDAEEFVSRTPNSIAIQADVSVATEVDRLIREVAARLGPVEVLINNAGIARPQPMNEINERDWDDLIDGNLKSCFLVTQAVLPSIRSRGWGRIVNLSSVAAQVGGVVGPHYAASKAGMLGLTRYYAAHLAREGICVNAIAPALIETEMVTSNPNAKASMIPVGRFGAPDEVAAVAVMLARNGYITGQTINVNGGWFLT